eukprot:TRINITY_DN5711_c0_g1_i1.p1 TRINITY_DN5711_c0_g1~~TRINITY_DN5711_c0_g1_i1.p1  ORF type:complete len:212 (-),score=45.15 TRINITY_DN5711_c0_g1_i1:38-673(-)
MISVAFFALMGFGLAFVYVQYKPGASHFTSVLGNPHAQLGLVIVSTMLLQIVLGVSANRLWVQGRKQTPMMPDRVHHWLGRLLLLAGLVNCFLGIWILNDNHMFSISTVLFVFMKVVMGCLFLGGHCALGHARDQHGVESEDDDPYGDRFNSSMERALLGTGSAYKYTARKWRKIGFMVIAPLVLVCAAIAVLSYERILTDLMNEGDVPMV